VLYCDDTAELAVIVVVVAVDVGCAVEREREREGERRKRKEYRGRTALELASQNCASLLASGSILTKGILLVNQSDQLVKDFVNVYPRASRSLVERHRSPSGRQCIGSFTRYCSIRIQVALVPN